jgi:hypothetical protein
MSHEPRVTSQAKRHLIACEVFRDEFEAVCPPEMARTYLEQGLHRTPGKMPEAIQAVVDGLSAGTETVILGYGLCSNGVVGVAARQAPIVLPKVHDCIAVLLGSVARYEAEMDACAGTYYITPGWAKYGTTSLSAYKDEYVPKYGEEDARYVVEECLKHYTRIAFIDHGVGDVALGRAHAKEFAETFGKRYEEIPGDLDYLRRLVSGPWDGPDFLTIPPGTTIDQAPFLGLHSISLP